MLGRLVRLICSSSGRLRGNSAVWIPEKRTPKGPLPPRTENHLPQVWVTRAPAGQIKEGEEEHTSPTAEESCIRCCNILPQQRGLPQWRTPKGIAVWIPLFCFPPGSSDCNHFKVGGGGVLRISVSSLSRSVLLPVIFSRSGRSIVYSCRSRSVKPVAGGLLCFEPPLLRLYTDCV